MSVLISAVQNTVEGQALISNCNTWNDAVHRKDPRPLTIFSTLAFDRARLGVQPNTPFARLIAPYGSFEIGSPEVQIDSRFKVDVEDVILHKTRWSATMGNSLEQILKAQSIDTVIISGLSLSGVVMSTIGYS